MEVILLEKIRNLGIWGKLSTLKQDMDVTTWFPKVKLFLQQKETLLYLKRKELSLRKRQNNFWLKLSNVRQKSMIQSWN